MKDNTPQFRQFMNTQKQPRPTYKYQAKFEQFDVFKHEPNFPLNLQQKLGDKVSLAYQQKLQKKSPLQIGAKNEAQKPQNIKKYLGSQYDQEYYMNGNGYAQNERIEDLRRKVKQLQQQAKQRQTEHTRKIQSWSRMQFAFRQENKRLKEDLIRTQNGGLASESPSYYISQIENLTKNVKKVERQNQALRQRVQQLQEEKFNNRKTEAKYKISKEQSEGLSKRQTSTISNYAYVVNQIQSSSNTSPLKNKSPSWKQGRPTQSNNSSYEFMIQRAQNLLSRENLRPDQLRQAESFLNSAKSALQSMPVKNAQSLQAQAYAYTCIINLKYQQKEPTASIEPFLQFVLNFYDVKLEDYFEEKIVLLNNHAIYLQRSDPKGAVNLYEQVLAIQERYYSRRDERRALTLNNLACAQCQLNNIFKGKKYFDQALDIVQRQSEIEKLVKQNYRYYQISAKGISTFSGMIKS